MKSAEAICKEISNKILEYKDLQASLDEEVLISYLKSAIHELEHLLRWINE